MAQVVAVLCLHSREEHMYCQTCRVLFSALPDSSMHITYILQLLLTVCTTLTIHRRSLQWNRTTVYASPTTTKIKKWSACTCITINIIAVHILWLVVLVGTLSSHLLHIMSCTHFVLCCNVSMYIIYICVYVCMMEEKFTCVTIPLSHSPSQ